MKMCNRCVILDHSTTFVYTYMFQLDRLHARIQMRLEVCCVFRGSVSPSRLSAREPLIFWDFRWCPEGDLNPHGG